MNKDFKMSITVSKSEKDLCRCCHSEGSFKNLYTSYFWLDVEEIMYSNVLRECFNIELLEMKDPSQQVLCTICYTCIRRLEDAVKFKRQIMKCEERFRNIYSGFVSKDQSFAIVVKQEIPEPTENALSETTCDNSVSDGGCAVEDKFEVDYTEEDYSLLQVREAKYKKTKNAPTEVKTENKMEISPEPAKDAEVLSTIEADTLLQVRKPKYRRTKKLPAKVKKKNKMEKTTESVKDEQVLSTIEGVIKVVKRLIVKRYVDYEQTDDGFQCLKCPQTFKSSNGVRVHVRTVHLNIPRHKCPDCAEVYPTLASFTKHKLEKHDIDHRFKCNACESAFNTKIQLKRHINTFHMLGEKIKCNECDYETFSMESLYKHRFKHKTVKDYQCRFCRKAFVRKTTLQLHERIHTGDRRKVCAVCGQAFVQKASLNYHMSKYHPEVVF